jgi:23S rRNA (adenine2503-C2)-methyltransferase
MIDFFELSPNELEAQVQSLGMPRFRAAQILNWVYQKHVADFSLMRNISKPDQEALKAHLGFFLPETAHQYVSERDGTQRFVFRMRDGAMTESVLLVHEKRRTVCISSQVGCALGCTFCATGTLGFERNLASSEIILQGWMIAQITGEKIQNVVFMGMGEPLLNFDAVMKAVQAFNEPRMFNLSIRRITLSTVGVVAQMDRLAQQGLDVCLSVSLHAASNQIRDRLIPFNQTTTIEELIQGVKEYIQKTHRRVTIEYILIRDLNDSDEDAKALAILLRGLKVNINVIPLNPVAHIAFEPSEPTRILAFSDLLRSYGHEVVLRREKGQDVQAACGQLRRSLL